VRRSGACGAGIPPLKGVDQVLHVLFQELVDDAQGILIGRGIEIKRSAEKMFGGIGEEELVGRSCVPADIEIDAADAVGRPDHRLIDRAGLIGVFEGHFEGILAKLVEAVRAYILVADIDTRIEAGKIDIDPIGILRHRIEKAAVLDDPGIHGVFERIRETRLIKGLIFMPGEIYFEITPPFGSINAIAGKKQQAYDRKAKKGHRRFNFRVAAG
jgi:hypothetical protein